MILSLGLDLAWRVSDFAPLRKSDIPDLNQSTPMQLEKITQKESVISSAFISRESVELLKAYVPTLPKENSYLLPSDLLWGTFSVYMDSVLMTDGVDYTKSENGTHWVFRMNYTHSTHTILIGGTEAIPEFTVTTATLVLMVVASFAAIVSARIRKRSAQE